MVVIVVVVEAGWFKALQVLQEQFHRFRQTEGHGSLPWNLPTRSISTAAGLNFLLLLVLLVLLFLPAPCSFLAFLRFSPLSLL